MTVKINSAPTRSNARDITASTVSVIIPTYNRSAYLERVIRSYVHQKAVKQIIIVNDGSTEDYTTCINSARQMADEQGVELLYLCHATRRGCPAARNSAIVQIRNSEIVLIADDDVFIAPDFVQIGLDCLKNLNADIVGGRMIDATEFADINSDQREGLRVSKDKVFNYWALIADYRLDPGEPIELPFVHTVSMWKRWIFDDGLRFDPNYQGNNYREDSAAHIGARKIGAKIFYCPQMVFWHVRSLRKGGVYQGSKLWWYYWALRNNVKFLNDHYRFIRSNFQPTIPGWLSFLALAIRLTSTFLPSNLKSIMKRMI